MNRVVLSHACPATPETAWYPYIRQKLTQKGFEMEIPQLPDPEHSRLQSWQNAFAPIADEAPANTVLIGHSLGCINVLRYLEQYEGADKFPLVILVAPPAFDLGYPNLADFFATPLDFSGLKQKAEKVVVLVTPTDRVLQPEPVQHGLKYVQEAGAKLIVLAEGGHFAPFDNVTELKEIVEEIGLATRAATLQ
ncbi:alpha/beta hydrolase [Hymenobacter sp. BT664]|uniref:Alpha/beta hydrolase n=1 Tax=Hymenobacter montanus TaxID=2771359 RepID=A0A927BCD9_9BACT|nr:alpha/beta hydrolase [Hymenobacter montanus]MBD2768202.1 alpha/beta hydrolase [Hymenobacter montanus]